MPFFGGGGASAMVGATASVAGSGGSVPAPEAGDQERFLTGGATFDNDYIPNIGSPDYDTTPTYFVTGDANSFVVPFGDVVYVSPIFIPKRIANPTIYFRCTGHSVAGTQGAKLLIYSHSAGLPYSLLYNSGAITIAQAAANYTHSSTNFTITRGIYWVGYIVSTGSMGFLSVGSGSNHLFRTIFGGTENTTWNNNRTCVGYDSTASSPASSYANPATTLPTKIRVQNTSSSNTYLAIKDTQAPWIGLR